MIKKLFLLGLLAAASSADAIFCSSAVSWAGVQLPAPASAAPCSLGSRSGGPASGAPCSTVARSTAASASEVSRQPADDAMLSTKTSTTEKQRLSTRDDFIRQA